MYSQTLLKSLLCLLVIVGALNWGYIAFTKNCEDDLVNAILPAEYSMYVYAAVGIAGLLLAALYLYKQRIAQRVVEGAKKGVEAGLDAAKAGYSVVKKGVKKVVK